MDFGAERVPVRAFGRDALWIAFLALAYFLAHEVALLVPDAQKLVAAIWPASGIGLAALLLSPRRRWPVILLILFLAGISADVWSGLSLLASVAFVTANVVESLACAWLISRWCGEAVQFYRVKEVLALIACATGVNACTAFLGAGTAALTSASRFWDAWQTWWVADGLGILLVTPLMVTWSDFQNWFRGLRWERTLESWLFIIAWCAVGWLAFRPVATFHPLSHQPYVLLGLLAWPALRLGQREVTLALVVLAALAVSSEAVSAGPLLWGGADILARLLAVQVWLAFIAAAGLLLTASYAETQSAERRSREGHDRLRALGDNLPNGMVYQTVREHDGSMRFLYLSGGIESITGVSPEEVLRDPAALYGLIVEEDRAALAEAEQASARNMSVFDVELRIRARNGEVRWVRASSTPRLLPDGRVLWDGIVMDITGRKREEAAREESEGRFRLVIENAELPVVITSMEDKKILFINACGARYFEVSPGELRRLRAPDFWRDPTARERFITGLSEAGRVSGFEVEMRTATGQDRWASVSASIITYGGQRATFAVFNDITALKEAAAKLEHERAVLSAIFQTASDMIWMKDAEGRYVACNSATERFFVLPASAIIGKMDHEIFPAEITEVIRAEDRAAIAAGGPRVDYAWVTICGESRQVLLETTKTPMLDGEGRLAGILCVARDITAAHLAQEALRERIALQEQMETTAAAVPGALYSLLQRPDGTLCLKYASPAFEDIHGVPPESYAEDLTLFWSQLLHPADLDRVRRAFSEAQRTSSPVHQEYRVRNPRKGETWVESRAVPVAQPDGSTFWHGFMMDISERKLAEATLAEEVVRRRILFEQANDGIAILDLNGKLQESNPAFARMLGYTQEEMRHLHVWDWDYRWTRQELLRMEADHFALPATFETVHRRKDGSVYEAEVSSSAAELGGIKYVYCVARDITRRKATEAALRESRRLEGIGILAGGMAHEFNNLLTVINGYSGILANSFDIHDPMREQVEAIRGAGERAAGLTRQLLTYGRKQIIRRRVLDLNLVVERTRRAWMPLLRPDISLKMELDASPGLVSIDADQIREVLVNLVKNAVEALPDGGELAISTANVQIGEEYAAQHADAHSGPYVMLSVADTGAGMDERTRARVFEPFFTTRDRATTTGLGLATVHGSVAQHEGWITVESALGKGSVFKIYLPGVEERRAGPDRSPEKVTGKPDHPQTILVVEVEDAVRRLTVSILKAHGYQILEAANGRQAKTLVEHHKEPIHLVLTDVILPGITGLELTEQLKARMPATKVLYVSGYPEAAIANYGIVPGEVEFIQKPYSPDLLAARIREILGSP
jgi:two-component system cell cycle sensor histidine kinase/response regulator CckA